jgi:hypothetical protein
VALLIDAGVERCSKDSNQGVDTTTDQNRHAGGVNVSASCSSVSSVNRHP